jgi:hypothetical protein
MFTTPNLNSAETAKEPIKNKPITSLEFKDIISPHKFSLILDEFPPVVDSLAPKINFLRSFLESKKSFENPNAGILPSRLRTPSRGA